MTELPSLFLDRESFQAAFVSGLECMLHRHDGLGVFILVLANASFDPLVQKRLRADLMRRFDQCSGTLRDALREGRRSPDASDDVDVFLRLMALGLEAVTPTRFRRVGPWRLQYNLVRALRPPRMAKTAVSSLRQPFDAAGFHFNKAFLRKEVFWEGDLLGWPARLLYNKFPFAPLHGLLVLDPAAERPQLLSEDAHRRVWALSECVGDRMPGFGAGYNSYGAYASVNHQHFQTFILEAGAGFPVESSHWRHNGGAQAYPVACTRHTDVDRAWSQLEELHLADQAYNLLYRPGCLYVLPRGFQGSYRHADWTGGFAWSELAGSITTFNEEEFEALDPETIEAEFAKLRL
ncbi:MAG: hypothetical protein D6720_03785 [Gammaproteobacteria bacterium]|nr:MAG: hypothetical protein D6720_03785 [Gammaproteobacteria bacterium]